MKKSFRIVAVVLCAILLCTLFPLTAGAADTRITLSGFTCTLGSKTYTATSNADGTIWTFDTSTHRDDQIYWDIVNTSAKFSFNADLPSVKVPDSPDLINKVVSMPVGSITGKSLNFGNTRKDFDYSTEYLEATLRLTAPDGTRDTTYTVRFLKYVKPIAPTAPLSVRIGTLPSGSISFPAVPGKTHCYEMVLSTNATMPYTVGVVVNNYYKNSAYVDGVQFTGAQYANGFKQNITFTKEKPYFDFHFVPGASRNAPTWENYESNYYVPATWRISVRYAGQPSSGKSSPNAAFSGTSPGSGGGSAGGTGGTDAATAATSVKTQKTLYLVKGKTAKLPSVAYPNTKANQKGATWTSSKESVATVSANGTVRAKAPGTAIIKVTAASGKYASCKVIVVKKASPLKSLKLNKTGAVTLKKGKTLQLSAKPTPAKATSFIVKWTSSKNAVATVDAMGKVTAAKKGTAVLTAKCGAKVAKLTVKVS